jgi:hypothetical protein
MMDAEEASVCLREPWGKVFVDIAHYYGTEAGDGIVGKKAPVVEKCVIGIAVS